jgi:hypothetical protein
VEGLAAVSWGSGRIDLFWIGPGRELMHRWWTTEDGWSADESLGGELAAPPAVTAWAEMWDRYWDGAAWHPWETLGGELVGQPAASSWGADRIDVFAPGRDGALWHRWWNGTEWVPWQRDRL